ncbi:MAG: hypothetical protein Q8R31_04720 [Candidatus Omnitrophota bacterium]|nr:hypothetical protein [Candidatus Omnitrophota bacterium]
MIDKVSIMNKARKEYSQQHEITVREEAKRTFNQYKDTPLFVAGIMLYWAEGMMSNAARGSRYTLALSNSKYELLKIYCSFIRRFLNLPDKKLRACLFLYPDLKESRIKRFWSKKLCVPISQFNKSIILNSRARITKNRLLYGTCKILANSRDARIIMETWIGCFYKYNLSKSDKMRE